MFKIFNAILQHHREEERALTKEDELQLATCILLLEIAQADGTIQAEEEKQIQAIIHQQFPLSEADSSALIEQARKNQIENVDLYPVAALINENLSTEEKCRLLENIWRIVYADGILDQHEDYLMHKLATLLHLSHRQLIDTKLEAKKSIV